MVPDQGHFNPRSPWGERPQSCKISVSTFVFQSTLPVGGATSVNGKSDKITLISIHAPRGGSDFSTLVVPFSIDGFQSTLPVGGATNDGYIEQTAFEFQSTLPVGGATTYGIADTFTALFQSTLPVGGATLNKVSFPCIIFQFQSTLPVGGATLQRNICGVGHQNFNPRSPWGERPTGLTALRMHQPDFNPRSPWGERRQGKRRQDVEHRISIHAPRGGSDCPLWIWRQRKA